MKKYRGVFIKNEAEISVMREANRTVSFILDEIEGMVRPGAKTIDFERKANELCAKYKVTPAFKGYRDFPFALCCSINEEVVHGFPSERVLLEGDIVSVDMGVIFQGFYGDSARTFAVGCISEKARMLLDVTRISLEKGIEAAKSGNNLLDISAAVQMFVEARGFTVVRRFVGHGIGRNLHEKPEIPNYVPSGGTTAAIPLKVGMCLAIEPMVCEGSPEVEILADRWTAVTKDRKLAAHFEHTVAITSQGPEILSRSI